MHRQFLVVIGVISVISNALNEAGGLGAMIGLDFLQNALEHSPQQVLSPTTENVFVSQQRYRVR